MIEFSDNFDYHYFYSHPGQNLANYLNTSSFALTDKLYFDSRNSRGYRQISFSKRSRIGDDEIYLSDLLNALGQFFAKFIFSNEMARVIIIFDDETSLENFLAKIDSLTVKYSSFNSKYLEFENQPYFLAKNINKFPIFEV